jgi:hypothetical protein
VISLFLVVKNISMKVAVGFALACERRARWHGADIEAGYARVRVDEIVHGYESLELDIPGVEGESIQGEVARGIILWPKSTESLGAKATFSSSTSKSTESPSNTSKATISASTSKYTSPAARSWV